MKVMALFSLAFPMLKTQRLATTADHATLDQVEILVVEDDAKTAQAILRGLETEDYAATLAATGDEGLRQLNDRAFDLVVLDWIEILGALRNRSTKPLVLLLTARDTVEDRVVGLDAGADDYLVKPFAFAELLARIRALQRRTTPEEVLRRQIGDLSVDIQSRRVWRAGQEIVLTPREFDLLVLLMSHEGQVVTRPMLAQMIWREQNRATPLDNVIDVHLAHLRKKLDEGRRSKLIQTVRGVGFMLREERHS
jgi:two-component system copper resistance phosphate regulon response regulator CusR